ncbi:unnamed protein product [Dracunculus medinensis]|uniref:Transmembrane protein n=1 Tax=Dracunculus medinensis TaxID=318479 RepID=A0A0N4UG87_DRAME|nr:unnamed protein product [Dracunculus medinensis]
MQKFVGCICISYQHLKIIKLDFHKLSALKFLKFLYFQLSSLLIVVFLTDGHLQWFFYSVALFCCIALLIISFLTIIELFFNFFAVFLCVLLTGIFIYDVISMLSGSFNHHKYMPPINIGRDGWRNRMIICSVIVFLLHIEKKNLLSLFLIYYYNFLLVLPLFYFYSIKLITAPSYPKSCASELW